MREWYKTGVTEKQEEFLNDVFSAENVMTFHKNYRTWLFNGETSRAAHSIEDSSNNCSMITDALGQQTRACIIADNLHLTALPESPKRRTEVYTRVP